jgi:probable rRNA maturation factor
VIINVIDQQTALKISVEQVQQLVQEVIRYERQSCDEVNIYFVDTPTICHLHELYFNDPSPTDCISFPMDLEQEESIHSRLLGELFVCPATAMAYADKHQSDPYQETTLYIVHSLLHLMGYDDTNAKARALMRQAERRHMEHLQSQVRILN